MSHGPTEENDLETQKCVLKATVPQFSDESIHRPGEDVPFDYSVDNGRFREIISLHLYANGISSVSKGYVSLSFRLNMGLLLSIYKYLELSYTVGVIDASGNKRFLRSFVFSDGPRWRTDVISVTFDVDRYIERETLLSEPLDLLPEGCLILHIDAEIKTISSVDKVFEVVNIVADSFTTESYGNERRYYLFLDSAVAERLKELSTYFQRMSESEMKETRTGCMEIPADEYDSFTIICSILMGSEFIKVHSLDEICQMYILSDKYDIPVAIESSRRLAVSFLRVKNDEIIVEHVDESIPVLLELAEKFNDVLLKEVVERFLKSKDEGAESGSSTREDIQDILDTEWEVEVGEVTPKVNSVELDKLVGFHLSKDVKKFQQKPEFDFYR